MLSADETKSGGKSGQRKRKAEGKKAEARKRKTVQEAVRQDPNPDRLADAPEVISAPVTSAEDDVIGTAPIESSLLVPETAIESVASVEEPPAETVLVDSAPAAEAVSTHVIAAELPATGLATIDWSPAASPQAAPVVPAKTGPAAAADIAPTESVETAPVSYQTIANAYGDITRRSFDQTTSFFEKFWGLRSFDKAFELQSEFAKEAYDNFVAESQKIRELHRELTRQRLQRWEGFVGMAKPR
jgi:hypothetical protein